jgi:hypothetical protein
VVSWAILSSSGVHHSNSTGDACHNPYLHNFRVRSCKTPYCYCYYRSCRRSRCCSFNIWAWWLLSALLSCSWWCLRDATSSRGFAWHALAHPPAPPRWKALPRWPWLFLELRLKGDTGCAAVCALLVGLEALQGAEEVAFPAKLVHSEAWPVLKQKLHDVHDLNERGVTFRSFFQREFPLSLS